LEEEGISVKGKASHFVGVALEEGSGDEEETESSIASQDQNDILAEIERMDLDEKTAMEGFVTLEKGEEDVERKQEAEAGAEEGPEALRGQRVETFSKHRWPAQEVHEHRGHQEGFSLQQLRGKRSLGGRLP
jgi:hypothetical protein